jgi:hypothetical protein
MTAETIAKVPGGQKEAAEATPPGIAFMITNTMKAELGKLGYTPEQIADLLPAQAHQILMAARKDTTSTDQFDAPVEITRFLKSGGPLTKRIELAADGSVKSDGSACVTSRGAAWRAQIADLRQLASLIEELRSDEAIALGALRPDVPDLVRIVNKKQLLNGVARPDVIARTSDCIIFSSGRPAFALLDYDTKGMPRNVAARLNQLGGYWPALFLFYPPCPAWRV